MVDRDMIATVNQVHVFIVTSLIADRGPITRLVQRPIQGDQVRFSGSISVISHYRFVYQKPIWQAACITGRLRNPPLPLHAWPSFRVQEDVPAVGGLSSEPCDPRLAVAATALGEANVEIILEEGDVLGDFEAWKWASKNGLFPVPVGGKESRRYSAELGGDTCEIIGF